MRIVVTSDTHYHPKWRDVLERFVDEIVGLRPDCVIVGGDVGERLSGFRDMLQLLQKLDCPRLILAGNHDLWMRDGLDSERLWSEALPNLTRQYGAIWLEDEIWSYNGLGICGTIGWYDYSARDPSLPFSDEQYFRDKDRYMADGTYMRWKRTDIEFANQVGDAFSVRLAALDTDPTIRETLVVTHVPAFESAILRMPDSPGWNLTNAYFGNFTLGKRIIASRKVSRVISGHTHIGRTDQISGAGGLIDMQVVPADYGVPVYVALDYPDCENK